MEIFAAIDIETTGLDFSKCEMIELAIVPLNRDFSLSAVPEFIARIKAEHPETAEAQALQVNGLNPADGDSRAKALENLLCWLTDNGIERIIPVAQNLEFDMRFITQTFPSLSKVFSRYGRDSMRLALAVNDICFRETGEPKFPKVSLQSLKEALNVIGDVQHNAFEDAKDAAIVYRRLLEQLTQR